MMKAVSEYKGVILLIIVLLTMSNMMTNHVAELNAKEDNNTIAYYEK